MSRLGKSPIKIPDNADVKISEDFIVAKGPKGELKQRLNKAVVVDLQDKEIKVSIKNPDDRKERAIWGLYWNLINNLIIGVTTGYEKKLEIVGVGYKATASGSKLTLSLGFSHQIEFPLPAGITAQAAANIITISGADKQLVGETAARIRRLKKPEPYKGKGIRYVDEIIRKKEGKAAAKGK